MPLQVITAGSISANYHVHIAQGLYQGGHSVVGGYTNETTLYIENQTQNVRVCTAGNYQTGSASSNLAVDIAPEGANASAFSNLFSASTTLTTTIPIQVGHVLRFRHTVTGAVTTVNASVDAWIG